MFDPPAAAGAVAPGAVVLWEAATPVEPGEDWTAPAGAGLVASWPQADETVAAAMAKVETAPQDKTRLRINHSP